MSAWAESRIEMSIGGDQRRIDHSQDKLVQLEAKIDALTMALSQFKIGHRVRN